MLEKFGQKTSSKNFKYENLIKDLFKIHNEINIRHPLIIYLRVIAYKAPGKLDSLCLAF